MSIETVTPVVATRRETEFFAALEGMRGVAALGVVCYHIFWPTHLDKVQILNHGLFFVDLFFVISGFVISHIYASRILNLRDLGEFAVLRTARLYPLHLFTLLLVLVLILVANWLGSHWQSLAMLSHDPRLQYSLRTFILNILMIHGVAPNHGFTFNRPSWSISTEYFTYFVFALVALVSSRRRNLLMILSIALATGACIDLWQHHGLATGQPVMRCLLGFFIGVLVQIVWQKTHQAARRNLKQGWMPHLIETIVVLAIGLAMTYCFQGRLQILILPTFAAGVFVFTVSRGWATRLLESRAIQYLGKWSYSIYMTHFTLLIICADILRLSTPTGSILRSGYSVWTFDGVTLLYLAAVLAVSSQTYRFIEVPPRSWAKRWVSRHRSDQTPIPVPP